MSRKELIDAVVYRNVKDNKMQGYRIEKVSPNELPKILMQEPLICEGFYFTYLTDGNILIIAQTEQALSISDRKSIIKDAVSFYNNHSTTK